MNKMLQRRPIRSYVLRQGRMTTPQRHALASVWSQYGLDPDVQIFDFKDVFGRDAPRILEIGFGNGESLLKQAEATPESDFIGIEVHKPGIGRLLHEVKQRGLKNLRVFRHDAVEVLNNCIPDEAIDIIQIFFPDPWPKKRHHKRRLIQPEFIELLTRKLKIGGRLHCATDWEHYAEQMLGVLSFSDHLLNLSREAGYYSNAYSLRPLTKFEQRGLKLNHKIRDIVFKKL